MKRFLYSLPIMVFAFCIVTSNAFADDTFVSAKYMDYDEDA